MNYSDPATPVWSLTRRSMYSFCPRSAVMYYREQPQGYLPDASDIQRKIAAAGKTEPDKKFIRQLILSLMRNQFYRNNIPPTALLPAAMNEFDLLIDRMMLGKAKKIPRSFTGYEVNFFERKQQLAKYLESCLLAIINSGIWEKLLDIPPAKRRRIPEVLTVQLNKITCLASPLCAAVINGRLSVFELRSGDISGAAEEISLIHRFYAAGTAGSLSARVDSVFIDYRTGEIRSAGEAEDLLPAMRRIGNDIGEWKRFYGEKIENIPGNKCNCRHCIFAGICNNV